MPPKRNITEVNNTNDTSGPKRVYFGRSNKFDGFNVDECVTLAKCYLYGPYIQSNPYRAVELLRKCVQKSDPEAQDLLATCYYYGTGVIQNFGMAFQLYEKSANAGFSDAQYNLGT